MSENKQTADAELIKTSFAYASKSPEYRDGMTAGWCWVRGPYTHDQTPPYQSGTAQNDAWEAGWNHGRELARNQDRVDWINRQHEEPAA